MPDSRYHWYGEEPFPWQLVVVWFSVAAVISLLLFGLIVAVLNAAHLL